MVLVTVDTLRADRLGCYGARSPETPAYDRLAREGALFENAVATNPLTLPAHASILTGRHPAEHGVHGNGNFALPASEATLASLLSARGFTTAAFVGAFPLSHRFGLSRGFDLFDDEFGSRSLPGGETVPRSERRAREVNARALPWLRARAGERFFLWLHYFDPHFEYVPEEPYASRYAAAPYDGEVAATDAALSELLGALDRAGLASTTLVVVMADHGEGLGDHGEAFHGVFLYDSTIRVPLILRAPDALPAGARSTAVVSGADVAPTLLEILGIDVPDSMTGRSALGAVRGAPPRSRAPLGDGAVCESFGPWLEFRWSPLHGFRTAAWKFIEAPEPELYDLANDPRETKNLAVARPELLAVAREARRSANAASAASSAAGAGPASKPTVPADAETIERLRSLGYAASAAAPKLPGPGQRLRDPKSMAGFEESYYRAIAMLNSGKDAGAAAAIFGVLARRDPAAPIVHYQLGRALYRVGRPIEAEREFTEALALDPSLAEAAYNIGVLCEARKEFATATSWFRKAAALEPDNHEARAALARRLYAAGDLRGAAAELRAALAASPSNADYRAALADLERRGAR